MTTTMPESIPPLLPMSENKKNEFNSITNAIKFSFMEVGKTSLLKGDQNIVRLCITGHPNEKNLRPPWPTNLGRLCLLLEAALQQVVLGEDETLQFQTLKIS